MTFESQELKAGPKANLTICESSKVTYLQLGLYDNTQNPKSSQRICKLLSSEQARLTTKIIH